LATQNFKVKNGLTVGPHDIIDDSGNVTVPGDLTVSGAFTIGDLAVTDSVTSDLIPNTTDLHSLGTPSLVWSEVHAAAFYGDGSGLTGVTSYTITDFNNDFATKDTDDLAEGVNNLYYTDARSRAAISVTGAGSYDDQTGVITITGGVTSVNSQTGAVVLTTSDVSEGTNLYFNTFRARNAIGVVDAGGDGSLTYDTYSGQITYTGPSASEIRAHFSAGTGITISDGTIATTITQYTDSLARAAISVDDAGGDGSLTYSSATGVITYTGPSASEIRAHFSAGAGITITDGVIAVDSTGDTEFSDITVDSIQFNTGAGVSVATGQVAWNTDDATFDFGLLNGVVLQNGQELHFYAKATSAISNGSLVMFAGSQGGHLLIAPADLTSPGFKDSYIVGVATQDFTVNQFGYVTCFGKVRGLNTLAYTEGTILYADRSTPGGLTAVKPTAPNHVIEIAAVVRSHGTQGTLLVRPTFGKFLSELHDVYISTVTNGDILRWNASTSRWENIAGTTTNIPEGTQLYFTTARARQSISVTDSGGDGSLSYNNSTGVITYTGPSASEIRAHFSAGTGVSITSGEIAIGQAVSTTSDVEFNTVTVSTAPTQTYHLTNKQYVDNMAQGLATKAPCKIATTSNLTGVYDNGTAGVGATFTIAATATLTIDGNSSWSLNDGILLKDQTDATENGRYYISQLGGASTDWILTRCIYCDTADEIPGSYILITDGSDNENTGWVAFVDNPDTFAVGTDDITYIQFSGAGTYTAGTGLSLAGTTFSNTGVLSVNGVSGEVSASDLLTAIKTVDGAGTGLDADLLDGESGSYYLDWTNTTNKPDPVITVTLTGDVTGTANTTLTDLASGTVTVATTIAANSVALGTDTTGNYVASLVAGTGIAVGAAGESATPTVTNTDPGSSQNIFKNIAVSGQSTIVADDNNDTLNVAAGSGISITTAASTDTLTVSHADTSSVDNLASDNSGNTFIQDISFTFDGFGHVTAASLATGTVSVGDGAMTVTAGSGLTGGGQLGTANQTGSSSITLSHADTSSASDLTASGRRYVTGLTFDTYGHVTAYTTGTETVTDTNTTYSLDGSGTTNSVNIELIAGGSGSGTDTINVVGSGATTVAWDEANQRITISSTDTDTNTTYTAGSGLTLAGTVFSHADTSSQASVDNSSGTVIQDITLDTYGHITAIGSVNLDSRYLGASSKAADSELLDGQDSSGFLRNLSAGSEASLDTYTDNGFRTISYSGYSKHLLSWNAGGSPGTVQQEFHYGVPSNGWRIRNKTDNTTWSSWGYVALTTGNQGHISGTIWHSGNDGSGSGLDADLLDGNDSNYFQKKTSIQDTAPSGAAGDLWYESDSGTLHVYYDGFWIDVAPQVGSSSNLQINSLGVGTTASGTTGQIRATNDVIAYYSDARLKTFEGTITGALDKVHQLNGYYFRENSTAKSLGYDNPDRQVGVSAQEVQAVLPEVVTTAPISDDYLTVKYDKLVPLLIEAIKEQTDLIQQLQQRIERLEGQQ
jgi:hypothetical protein